MKLQHKNGFKKGLNVITQLNGKHKEMLMDFSILNLDDLQVFSDDLPLERIFLILQGHIKIEWENNEVDVSRDNVMDDKFWALNVPKNVKVTITSKKSGSEVCIMATENEKIFDSNVRSKENSRYELRGKGFMNEAATRIVKTMMDHSLTPWSNFVLGEDVQYPGKWAGFPSHHHPQPEIYFYRLLPEHGFGLLKLGEEGVVLEHNDVVLINPNLVHPQVAAPGYAMYFLWVIRHLDGNPYIKPTFEEEHLWTEKQGAKYWPNI